MKKILAQIGLIFVLMNLALTVNMGVTLAQETPPEGSYFSPLKQIQEIGEQTGLPDFVSTGQHPDAPPDYLQEGIGAATSPIYFAIDFFRYVMSGIALIVVVVQAVKLITTASDEEATKAKTGLLVGIAGLLVIQLADVVVKKMFFGEQGEAFENIATAEVYAEESVAQIRGIIGFLEVLVGAVAVLVIVLRGFVLITSGGDEESMTKAKNHILYALAGLAIVALSEVIVRGVVFPAAGEELPDVAKGTYVIVTLTNYLAGFISVLAFVVLFYGGYRYVVSAGDEEMSDKIKKIILGSVIALVLALGAFAIVNTVLDINPSEDENTETSTEQVELVN